MPRRKRTILEKIRRCIIGPPGGVIERATRIKRVQEINTRRNRELLMGVPASESVVGTGAARGRWREPTGWNLMSNYDEVLPPHPDDRKWIGRFRVIKSSGISGALMDLDTKWSKHVDLGALQREIYGRVSRPRAVISEDKWVVPIESNVKTWGARS